MSPILARRIILWSALAGLFVSTYLLVIYVSGAPIVCGLLHGCDIVRNSKWAYSFGLPRPLFGVAFYVGIIALLACRALYPRWRVRWLYHLSMLAAVVGFLESAFLVFVQWLDIKAFCIWCLASAVAATIIFIVAWFDRPESMDDQQGFKELKFVFWSFAAALIVGATLIFFMVAPSINGEPERLEPVTTENGQSSIREPEDSVPIPGTTAEHVYSPDGQWHAYILWKENFGEMVVEEVNGSKRVISCIVDFLDLCNPTPIAFSSDNLRLMYVNIIDTGPAQLPAVFIMNLITGESEQITNLDKDLSSSDPDVRRAHFVPSPLYKDFRWESDMISYSFRGVYYSINTKTKVVEKTPVAE